MSDSPAAPHAGLDPVYTARCLCGGVRLNLYAEPGPIDLCHCAMCRRETGSAFACNAPIAAESVSVVAGAEHLRAYESSPGKDRVFCGRCGSPVFSRSTATPGVLRLRMGLVDGELRARPFAHWFVGSKPNWWCITDDLPQHEGG
jgi:hypothetical protein